MIKIGLFCNPDRTFYKILQHETCQEVQIIFNQTERGQGGKVGSEYNLATLKGPST